MQPASQAAPSVPIRTHEAPDSWLRLLPLLRCPVTARELNWNTVGQCLESARGGARYSVRDGIPVLFAPNEWPAGTRDVTDVVKAFYEETPFPNYEDLDSRESLARLLDEQLPRPVVMLEAGCGTGQLSNFLGMGWNRLIVGGDVCLNSLRLAKTFRDRFSINNTHFVQMNLFRPPFKDQAFGAGPAFSESSA